MTRKYALVPIRSNDRIRWGDRKIIAGTWQHLNVPGDLRLHLTSKTPRRHQYVREPTVPPVEWQSIAAVISPTPLEMASCIAPPGKTTTYGPGVVVIAPDVPDAKREWRFVVEMLAGPSSQDGYPPSPFDGAAIPVPMQSGNVVLRAPTHEILPASNPTGASVAFRCWWIAHEIETSGVIVF